VLTSHVDSPKVIIETAEKPRRLRSGYHASPGRRWAPRLPHRCRMGLGHALCGAGQGRADGRGDAQLPARRLKDGYVKCRPTAPPVARRRRKKADEIKAAMLKGGYALFKVR